jgi:hypothetical protein
MDRAGLSKNLILLFTSVVFSCFLIEIAFRFFLFGGDSLSIEKMNSLNDIGVSGLLQRSQHSEIVWELQPNLRCYNKLVRFETNSFGLRDKEYQQKKPDGTFRVAVIGDSFTMPAGVRIEDAYHTVLEDRLNAEGRDLSFEFINFAVGGYSLRQYWANIEYKAAQYDPDMILIGFYPGNDYVAPPERIFNEPYQVREAERPFFRSFALYSAKKFRSFLGKREGEGGGSREGAGGSDAGEGYLEDMLSRIGAFSVEHGVPVLIVHLAVRPANYARLQKAADDNGIYFLDVSYLFGDKKLMKHIIYPIEAHPNAKAHKMYADRINDYLTEMKLLPPSAVGFPRTKRK